MFKKIDIFINGKYWASTNRYKTCKQAIASISRQVVNVCQSAPINKEILVSNSDKVTAHFARKG